MAERTEARDVVHSANGVSPQAAEWRIAYTRGPTFGRALGREGSRSVPCVPRAALPPRVPPPGPQRQKEQGVGR